MFGFGFCIKIFFVAILGCKGQMNCCRILKASGIRKVRKKTEKSQKRKKGMEMKKDDRNQIRRERFIMISTSALVLTALTLTGVYMRNHTQSYQDKGYTLDFSAFEDRADDKLKDIAHGSGRERNQESAVEEFDLPVLDLEAGADDIVIPGIDDAGQASKTTAQNGKKDAQAGQADKTTAQNGKKDAQTEKTTSQNGKKDAQAGQTEKTTAQSDNQNVNQDENTKQTVKNTQDSEKEEESAAPTEKPVETVEAELHFNPSDMQKPVSGTAIIEYSMDHSVYFATLNQYKYNPAVIYGAKQGEAVCACTRGRVMNIHDDPELGRVLVMDLGDGYQAIYGQLENIEVPIGAAVDTGTKLATVAAPTKYYSVEGANLYFQLKKDGESVNPGEYF